MIEPPRTTLFTSLRVEINSHGPTRTHRTVLRREVWRRSEVLKELVVPRIARDRTALSRVGVVVEVGGVARALADLGLRACEGEGVREGSGGSGARIGSGIKRGAWSKWGERGVRGS